MSGALPAAAEMAGRAAVQNGSASAPPLSISSFRKYRGLSGLNVYLPAGSDKVQGKAIMKDTRNKHLLWRAGFGYSPAEWTRYRRMETPALVDTLFEQAERGRPLPLPEVELPADRSMRRAFIKEQIQLVGATNAAWLRRMADPAEPALLERMTLFWHGHFACRIRNGRLAVQQLNALRAHALGNFRDLLRAVSRDPAMIRFLNNQQNRKQQPNENYARELMELFTLGRGHYTEQDVKEAARAFTGWSSNLRGAFVFRANWHDEGVKTVFGQSGRYDGDDIIDLILEKPQAARFVAGKVYRYFVNEQADEARVDELARVFYQSGYDIAALMRHLFSSDWFYDPAHMGSRIKGPVELIAGLSRQLGVLWTADRPLVFLQRALGQMLFNPPNVAGWPLGRSWIDNSTLMIRLNLASLLFSRAKLDLPVRFGPEDGPAHAHLRELGAQVRLEPLQDQLGRDFDQLAGFFLLTETGLSRSALQEGLSPSAPDFLQKSTHRLLSLPEYQIA